jgi:hypothetical protein
VTTARDIITGALRFRLNRLSPGEALDADLADTCLEALNAIVDEMNGSQSMLWREILTAGTVTAVTGTLGTTWSTLSPGVPILGASYLDGTLDTMLERLTMEQYHALDDKTQAGNDLQYFAHDGAATVYFWPVPTSRSVTLRTRYEAQDFADLDTDYSMPRGYMSALGDIVAERVASSVIGSLPAEVARYGRAARMRLQAQASSPGIISGGLYRANILTGP